jgi:hypothetical protein
MKLRTQKEKEGCLQTKITILFSVADAPQQMTPSKTTRRRVVAGPFLLLHLLLSCTMDNTMVVAWTGLPAGPPGKVSSSITVGSRHRGCTLASSFNSMPARHPGWTQTVTMKNKATMSLKTLSLMMGNNNDIEMDQETEFVAHVGTYRKFADYAWNKLLATGLFHDGTTNENSAYHYKASPAKGIPNSMVQMTTRAMGPNTTVSTNLLRYARFALLETVPNTTVTTQDASTTTLSATTTVHTQGIQVLNLVVFPSTETTLPAWGVDLVSLPGGKHLMLMDVHPMTLFGDDKEDLQSRYPHHVAFRDWHEDNVIGSSKDMDTKEKWAFPWGGDVPDEVAKYVSPYALWTRMKEEEGSSASILNVIDTNLFDAFCGHLDLYLDLVQTNRQSANNEGSDKPSPGCLFGSNDQSGYIEYRRTHDPAKPMLNALYGPDYASRVLEKVLFPPTAKQ